MYLAILGVVILLGSAALNDSSNKSRTLIERLDILGAALVIIFLLKSILVFLRSLN